MMPQNLNYSNIHHPYHLGSNIRIGTMADNNGVTNNSKNGKSSNNNNHYSNSYDHNNGSEQHKFSSNQNRIQPFEPGSFIRLFRNRLGMTQKQLARELNSDKRTVLNWENEYTLPDATSLNKLLALFLSKGVLTPKQEFEEAQMYWSNIKSYKESHSSVGAHYPMFDATWFTNLLEQYQNNFLSSENDNELASQPESNRDVDTSESIRSESSKDNSSLLVPTELKSFVVATIRDFSSSENPVSNVIDNEKANDLEAKNRIGVDDKKKIAQELVSLQVGLLEEKVRCVILHGAAGVGKTVLARQVVELVKPNFEVVLWQTLDHTSLPGQVLKNWVQLMWTEDQAQTTSSVVHSQQIFDPMASEELLLEHLIQLTSVRKCLIVLDQTEVILQPGSRTGQYYPKYTFFGRIVQRLMEQTSNNNNKNSTLLLIGRELPNELEFSNLSATVDGMIGTEIASSLKISMKGLDIEQCFGLLDNLSKQASQTLFGSEADRRKLIALYDNNPLYLQIIARVILKLYGGNIAKFLEDVEEDDQCIFGEVTQILENQYNRLSNPEKEVADLLAKKDLETLTIDEMANLILQAGLATKGNGKGRILEGLSYLEKRSLLLTKLNSGKAVKFGLDVLLAKYIRQKKYDLK